MIIRHWILVSALLLSLNCHAENIELAPLTKDKEQFILKLKEFSEFPASVNVLYGALYYPLSKDIDLVDVNNVADIFSGVYKINFKLKTAERIAPNMRYNKPPLIKVKDKLVSLTIRRTAHQGFVYSYLGLLVIDGSSVTSKDLFNGQYWYTEDEYPSCGRDEDERKNSKDSTMVQLDKYEISTEKDFQITLFINSTNCASGEHSKTTKVVDESILN